MAYLFPNFYFGKQKGKQRGNESFSRGEVSKIFFILEKREMAILFTRIL